jgi:hypothetical protein
MLLIAYCQPTAARGTARICRELCTYADQLYMYLCFTTDCCTCNVKTTTEPGHRDGSRFSARLPSFRQGPASYNSTSSEHSQPQQQQQQHGVTHHHLHHHHVPGHMPLGTVSGGSFISSISGSRISGVTAVGGAHSPAHSPRVSVRVNPV